MALHIACSGPCESPALSQPRHHQTSAQPRFPCHPPPQVREPNLKYLALENMARLAEVPAVVDTGACVLCRLGCGWCGSHTCLDYPTLQAIHTIWAAA